MRICRLFITRWNLLFLLVMYCFSLSAQKVARGGGKKAYKIALSVVDDDNQPLIFARCELQPLGTYAVTDVNGNATFENVMPGEWLLKISYVGMNEFEKKINVASDIKMPVKMYSSTLALDEVEVVARKNAAGESTSSIISNQAISHLQAFSLDDIMQLVPGQLMKNTDLTSQSNLQIRGLVNDNNNAFGSSIVMDGMQLSNNGAVNQGGFSSTSFVGTDLRTISSDDIESVEVVRGVPSAEYGDLTSGLTVIHSRVGVTPWNLKMKVNPSCKNVSASKGFKIMMPGTHRKGTLNFSFDYAQAWGDPRMKTKSFNRYTGSLNLGYDITNKWHTTTKLRYNMNHDWSGDDPDATIEGSDTDVKNQNFSINHSGKFSINKMYARTISYTLGMTLNNSESRYEKIVPVLSGLQPILTATETGYYSVPWATSSYKAAGGNISSPGNFIAKVTDQFYIKKGKTNQNFKGGIEYHYDWNNARGYYNDDDRYPLSPNNNGRPRAYYDIPGMHQFNAFVEDKFTWNFAKKRKLVIQPGVRFTMIQPFKDEMTYSVSPRINSSIDVTRWMDLRLAYGRNSKTPSLDYLYPDKKYVDRVAANYMPQDNEAGKLLVYNTYVYDVKRTVGLQNATNDKYEVGMDFQLPGKRKVSVIGYYEKMGNGFSSDTEYIMYTSNYYSASKGLITAPGEATKIDWNNPERTDTLYISTGKVGNLAVSVNKGLEIDFDLGEIEKLRTHVYLTGAYSESQHWNKGYSFETPTNIPTSYKQYGTTPFKIVYPASATKTVYRRFNTNLRFVTHIPALKMVASLSGQVIWYNYSHNVNKGRVPVGWVDNDGSYYSITDAMLADKDFTIKGVKLSDQITVGKENVPITNPITWLVAGRLTKELGTFASLSFYVNNMLYYEPYLSSSASSTLTQRNTGTFSFGFELAFKL
ncbi:MAG: TonB-dependent receptor plug domain-containing protein [Bacteroidaceae bacterium]|nr:TonB-dependent receptor plug domain-containing protein [Bacteroidaceae bacterium]